MRFIVLLLLFVSLKCSLALSEGEKTAIEDLLEAWPVLRQASPPWTSNASEACDIPFGGLTCSQKPDQHVVGLNLNLRHSEGRGYFPETMRNLVWMQNLTIELEKDFVSLYEITSIEALQYLKILMWDFSPTFEFPDFTPLQNLIRLEILMRYYQESFPGSITRLRKLRSLTLGSVYNPETAPSFSGSIPDTLCEMPSLVELHLVRTGFKSGLQRCFGRWPHLQVLNLENSKQMIVPLNSLLSGRPELKVVSLSNVPINGEFILAQTELELLKLDGTNIHGEIPTSLWNNTKLKILKLPGPSVRGTLPAAIGNLTSLEQLDLNSALVVGSIPPEIGLCSSLKAFKAIRTKISGTLPSEIGNLSQLETLDLAFTSIAGSIPTSFNRLKSLFGIDLTACKLTGTIPEGLLALPKLSQVVLSQNGLTGTIPAEITSTCYVLDLSSNLLTGSIPDLATRYCQFVTLSNNALSGPINLQSGEIIQVLLANNRFEGSLPLIKANSSIWIDFSSNFFSGTIPAQYSTLPFESIDLTNNNLEGNISNILDNNSVRTVKLSANKFSGTIPIISLKDSLTVLLLSDNRLTGTIPTPPAKIVRLSLSGNLLHGGIDDFFSAIPRTLLYLDLSRNNLEGTLPPIDKFYYLSYVFLSSNNFSGTVARRTHVRDSFLRVLDLSNNRLEGDFPMDANTQIPTLLLANNSFTGGIPNLQDYSLLSILDISNNQFSFDASLLTESAYLQYLSAQHNQISGNLNLFHMKSLKSADFSFNKITQVDFESVAKVSQGSNLAILFLNNNSIHEPRGTLQRLLGSGALKKTSTRTPSTQYTGVVCSQLGIGGNKNVQFEYDESAFSYDQCECGQDHFGIPPFQCRSCNSVRSGSSLCGGDKLILERNYYIFNGDDEMQTELCVPEFQIAKHGKNMVSNCLGVKIRFDYNGNHFSDFESNALVGSTGGQPVLPSDSQLTVQCRPGSSGRLCSRCSCDVFNTNGTCYFPGPGNICHKCSKVLTAAVFVPAGLAVLIASVIALSIIFYFILSSKRSLQDLQWERLSILKRIVYRLIDLTTFGHITITVTFVQILIELTEWDSVFFSWLKIVNGESEGLGLRCLFPIIANPIILLVFRLLIPFFVIGIVCGSIAIAEMIHRFKSTLQVRKQNLDLGSDLDATSDDIISDTTLLMADTTQDRKVGTVSYPALALATSTSISIIKFFYFGTTMASFEYLFYSVQKGTNKKFAQSIPWMSYDDAKTLRMISIPFVLLFLAIIPIAFISISWKFRHKIASPFVRLYFGSLFENFQNRLFWWELVNVLRKLSVALFLRGLPPSNSFQLVLISFVLLVLGVLMMELKPWKLPYENWSEGVGSILLVFSFGSARLGNLGNSSTVSYIFLAADIVFVLMCLAIIIWRCIRDETNYEKMWKLRFKLDSHVNVTDAFGPPLLNDDISEHPLSD